MDKNALYRFFSNKTTLVEEKKVLDWMDTSSENRLLFFEERKRFDTIIFSSEKEKFIIEDKPLKTEKRRIRLIIKEVAKFAAVAAFLIAISLFYVNDQKKSLTSVTNKISVPAGQRIDLTLPDGSIVALNSMSEIEYPILFKENRKVKLKGEAYFEVTRDEYNPFIVETSDYGIEVLGTTFNVNSDTKMKVFNTSLIEGEIRVFNLKNREESFILKPNEEILLHEGELVLQAINDFDRFRWRDGLFCFTNTSLDTLFHQIEKYYDVEIIFEQDPLLSSTKLNGKIRISDGIEHVMRVLLKDSELKYEKHDNIIHINNK